MEIDGNWKYNTMEISGRVTAGISDWKKGITIILFKPLQVFLIKCNAVFQQLDISVLKK